MDNIEDSQKFYDRDITERRIHFKKYEAVVVVKENEITIDFMHYNAARRLAIEVMKKMDWNTNEIEKQKFQKTCLHSFRLSRSGGVTYQEYDQRGRSSERPIQATIKPTGKTNEEIGEFVFFSKKLINLFNEQIEIAS